MNCAAMSAHNSNGPTTGSIFVGHMITPQALNDASTDPLIDSDISLKAAFIIEGIHVVPNKITPPGFDVEGRTRPDIHMRPFNLTICARNIDDSKELIQILTLTITGGCQWIPILPPFNSIAIDHLRFNGDFEIVTVIIHGIKLDTPMLSAAAQQVIRIPYRDSLSRSTSKMDADSDAGDLADEELVEEVDETATHDTVSLLIPKKILSALHARTNSYSHAMNAMERSLPSHSPTSKLQAAASCDPSKGSCMVAIEVVAELVGAVFSLEDDNTCSDPQLSVRTDAVNNLIKIMELCWNVRECEISLQLPFPLNM